MALNAERKIVIARSSVEAGYKAIASAWCESVWQLTLFKDLSVS